MNKVLDHTEIHRVVQGRAVLGRMVKSSLIVISILCLALELTNPPLSGRFPIDLGTLCAILGSVTVYALYQLYRCPACNASLLYQLDGVTGPDQVIANADGTQSIVYGPPDASPRRDPWSTVAVRLLSLRPSATYPQYCPRCAATLK